METLKYGKEREEPKKQRGCRWNMVSVGLWGQVRLLQEYLGEGPENATGRRHPQHQSKALHVKLPGLAGEHEEAPGDEEDHQAQRRAQLLQLEDQREDQDEEDG